MLQKEALELIQETAVKAGREVKITVKDYGAYSNRKLEAYYDDNYQVYITEKTAQKVKAVSNIDSFIAAVTEEARHLEKKTGDKMMVSFSQVGGYFQPDVDFESKGIKYNYNRKFSNQWKMVKIFLEDDYRNHFSLIQSIQALKPSLDDSYLDLMRFYSLLKLNSSSELVSQPIFTNNGELGEGYIVQFSLTSGAVQKPDAQTQEQYLPTKLKLKLPYVKNSDKLYDLELELSIIKNVNNGFAAKFLCPDFEQVEEQAMKDEIDKFTNAMFDGNLTDLLITESF